MEAKLEGREWENICLGSHLLAFRLLNKLGNFYPCSALWWQVEMSFGATVGS